MKTILISFASTNSRYHKSLLKLGSAAKQYFDGSALYTEHNIGPEFKQKNSLLMSFPRGFGYWCWKPYVIINTLKLLKDGDMCLYMDAGNSIVSSPNILFDLCKSNGGILLFNNRDGSDNGELRINRNWTKRDCFTMMGCDTPEYIDGIQTDASYQVYEKNDRTMEFLNQYMYWCKNIHVITDTPNITNVNHLGFVDHRHDQSILSLLAIKHGIKLFEEPSEWGNKTRPKDYPYQQIFNHHRGVTND